MASKVVGTSPMAVSRGGLLASPIPLKAISAEALFEISVRVS
jgi:hypothetical protein